MTSLADRYAKAKRRGRLAGQTGDELTPNPYRDPLMRQAWQSARERAWAERRVRAFKKEARPWVDRSNA